MIESTGDTALDGALAQLAASAAAVASFDLAALVKLDGPSLGLHAAARVVERIRRSLGAFDTAYVSAIESGDEAARFARTSTVTFLRDQLRISAAEARRRVELSHACAARSGFSGEPLPPRLPVLASAIADGVVSADHAAVVVAVLDAVPESAGPEARDVVEAECVRVAGHSEPGRLARWGVEALNRIDPDGALRGYDYAHARRGLTVTPHRGRAGGRISGELSVELLEKFQTIFDALSGPRPASPDAGQDASNAGREPGTDASGLPTARAATGRIADERSPAARRHDAVLDAFDLVLAGGDLPASGGTPATVVIHVTSDQLAAAADGDRRAMAVTDHGHRIPVPDALRVAGMAAIYTLIKDSKDVPLSLGRTARIASPGQTVALAARDRGCCFPDCDRPPAFCQRHHVVAWQHGGETRIDLMMLLCGYHHREFEPRGWKPVMKDGQPWWIPPSWVDPEQKPIRNHAHDFPDVA